MRKKKKAREKKREREREKNKKNDSLQTLLAVIWFVIRVSNIIFLASDSLSSLSLRVLNFYIITQWYTRSAMMGYDWLIRFGKRIAWLPLLWKIMWIVWKKNRTVLCVMPVCAVTKPRVETVKNKKQKLSLASANFMMSSFFLTDGPVRKNKKRGGHAQLTRTIKIIRFQ